MQFATVTPIRTASSHDRAPRSGAARSVTTGPRRVQMRFHRVGGGDRADRSRGRRRRGAGRRQCSGGRTHHRYCLGVARLGTSRRRHDCARGSSGHGSNSSDRCDIACPFRPAAAFAARRAKRFAHRLARPERGRTHRALRLALRRYHQCRNRACSTRAGSVRWRTAIFACVHSLLTIDVLPLA